MNDNVGSAVTTILTVAFLYWCVSLIIHRANSIHNGLLCRNITNDDVRNFCISISDSPDDNDICNLNKDPTIKTVCMSWKK